MFGYCFCIRFSCCTNIYAKLTCPNTTVQWKKNKMNTIQIENINWNIFGEAKSSTAITIMIASFWVCLYEFIDESVDCDRIHFRCISFFFFYLHKDALEFLVINKNWTSKQKCFRKSKVAFSKKNDIISRPTKIIFTYLSHTSRRWYHFFRHFKLLSFFLSFIL